MYSKFDDEGRLAVACSECERGGNGADDNKCACGGLVKRYNGLACFAGKLMAQYLDEVVVGAANQ